MSVNPSQQIDFSVSEREAVYKSIFSRRDVRRKFLPDAISDQMLARLLSAAHHAPSVGFMQPWNFIVIKSESVKANVKECFAKANRKAEKLFTGEKKSLYSRLKLEGIMEAPVNICITCDRKRNGPVVLGRTSNPEMDLYSCVCAVQNLWLAARAEGVGVGWVSIFEQDDLQKTLGIPEHIVPVAYLCLGYVSQFADQPDLEKVGWLKRLKLEELVFVEGWGHKVEVENPDLCSEINENEAFKSNFL